MHVRNIHAKFGLQALWCACKLQAKDSSIKSMNKFMYYGVIPLMTQDVNPAIELFTVKLRPIDYI